MLPVDCLRHIASSLSKRDAVRLASCSHALASTLTPPPHALIREAIEHLAITQWIPYCNNRTLTVDISTPHLSFMTLCWRDGILSEFCIFRNLRFSKHYKNRDHNQLRWHPDISAELDAYEKELAHRKKKTPLKDILITFNTIVPAYNHLPKPLCISTFTTT